MVGAGLTVLIDVRSEGEYSRGHIPSAYSLPLLTDAERCEVGMLYKRKGRSAAFSAGLQIVGEKMQRLYAEASELAPQRRCRLYCWRGGLRSQALAQLLRMGEIDAETIPGGYKAHRRWAQQVLQRPRRVVVVGGMSGSGKTAILHSLAAKGAQVLDLEVLANHRGSAFGRLGKQPTNEHFENLIASKWAHFDASCVFVEHESRMIGSCKIPDPIERLMAQAPLIVVECPKIERLERLSRDYAKLSKYELKDAVERLRRRLGDQRTRRALQLIEAEDPLAIDEVLYYYDRAYAHAVSNHSGPVHRIALVRASADAWADQILEESHDRLKACAL